MPKGRSKRALVGLGEYELPATPPASAEEVRNRFLFCIRQDAPHVVEELRLVADDGTLRAWGRRWHLEDDWILDVANRTRDEWHRWPQTAARLEWADVVRAGEIVPEPPVTLKEWLPTLESEADFLCRVDAYVKNVREWATTNGLSPTLQKRQLDRDLQALVAYQVLGWDLAAVDDEYFDDRSDPETVRKSLRSLSTLIGLTLRK